jgi:hypothetical protein
MCYAITAVGLRLLHDHDCLKALLDGDFDAPSGARPEAAARAERLLRQARHDVHVSGWALALERALDTGRLTLHGPVESVLSPPSRSTSDGRAALGPDDLILPGGRTPHEFLRTGPTGKREQVERFETVRPDLTVELTGRLGERVGVDGGLAKGTVAKSTAAAVDLLVELDNRLPSGRAAGKLERYDHLVAGWSVHTTRYGRRLGVPPVVVFVCRDRARARECARRADAILTACRAYAGEYPSDWEYPGRERIMFMAERDVHERCLHGYCVPRLPPDVRVSVAQGDPRARAPTAELRELCARTPADERGR